MPRMLPSRPDLDAPDSERKVFAAFERLLPLEWTAFHSRRLVLPRRGPGQPVERELDFLVIDPKRGLLGLEVKGGVEVGRDEDGWYSGTAPRHRIKAPGQQVQAAMHTLAEYLRGNGLDVPFGWGVVFPDAEAPDNLGPDLPRALVIDRESLQWADKALESVMTAALGVDGERRPGSSAPADWPSRILHLLAPRVSLARSLAASVAEEGAALVRLTEEQFNILELLADFPRVGVSGGTGSGKTLVAMERARRLAAEGRRVLFLCFNKALAAHLRPQANGFKVSTFHALADELSRAAGLEWPDVNALPDAQAFWKEQAPEYLLQALDKLPNERYDAVIVDEAQDFHELWWLAVQRLLRRPQDDALWVFFDPKQNIFGGSAWDMLKLHSVPLTFNCRNTQRIARYAYGLVDAEPRLRPGTPGGAEVVVEHCDDQRSMIDAVRRALHRLIVEGRLSSDRVMVLSPLSQRTSAVWREGTFGNFRLVPYPSTCGAHDVQFATLQSFKGLEADAVVLCEAGRSKPGTSNQHLYVAASRARHLLVVAEYSQSLGSRESGTLRMR